MIQVQAVSLFCEDIRHEYNGQKTIVGTFTDSVAVEKFPAVFPRIAIYSRVNVPIDFEITRLAHFLVGPEGNVVVELIVEQKLIESNQRDARSKKQPMYGFISEAKLSMFRIEGEGMFSVATEINDEKLTTGVLNIRLAENA